MTLKWVMGWLLNRKTKNTRKCLAKVGFFKLYLHRFQNLRCSDNHPSMNTYKILAGWCTSHSSSRCRPQHIRRCLQWRINKPLAMWTTISKLTASASLITINTTGQKSDIEWPAFKGRLCKRIVVSSLKNKGNNCLQSKIMACFFKQNSASWFTDKNIQVSRRILVTFAEQKIFIVVISSWTLAFVSFCCRNAETVSAEVDVNRTHVESRKVSGTSA